MREVVWTDDALREFDSAVEYLGRESSRASTVLADRIEQGIELLAQRAIGRPGRVEGTYEKVVRKTSYIVAYALSNSTITILHIIHTRRDWPDDDWPA